MQKWRFVTKVQKLWFCVPQKSTARSAALRTQAGPAPRTPPKQSAGPAAASGVPADGTNRAAAATPQAAAAPIVAATGAPTSASHRSPHARAAFAVPPRPRDMGRVRVLGDRQPRPPVPSPQGTGTRRTDTPLRPRGGRRARAAHRPVRPPEGAREGVAADGARARPGDDRPRRRRFCRRTTGRPSTMAARAATAEARATAIRSRPSIPPLPRRWRR